MVLGAVCFWRMGFPGSGIRVLFKLVFPQICLATATDDKLGPCHGRLDEKAASILDGK